MSFSQTITRSYRDGDGAVKSYIKTVETDSKAGEFSGEIAIGATDKHIEIVIPIATLKSFLMGSNKDLTVECNHPGGTSTAPDQTIALKANCPIVWSIDDVEACPLDQALTDLYVTNASGAAAQFDVRSGVDGTPP